jgi:hypothetical protein
MNIRDIVDSVFKIGIIIILIMFIYTYQKAHEDSKDNSRYHFVEKDSENAIVVFDSKTGRVYASYMDDNLTITVDSVAGRQVRKDSSVMVRLSAMILLRRLGLNHIQSNHETLPKTDRASVLV